MSGRALVKKSSSKSCLCGLIVTAVALGWPKAEAKLSPAFDAEIVKVESREERLAIIADQDGQALCFIQPDAGPISSVNSERIEAFGEEGLPECSSEVSEVLISSIEGAQVAGIAVGVAAVCTGLGVLGGVIIGALELKHLDRNRRPDLPAGLLPELVNKVGDAFISTSKGELATAAWELGEATLLTCIGPGLGVGAVGVDTINNVLVVLFGRWSK